MSRDMTITWRYYIICWNNRRICSASDGLPPMVKRKRYYDSLQDTEEDSVVIYKYDKNGNELATANRYEIPSEKKDKAFIDIDVSLGDNRFIESEVGYVS